MQSDDPTSQVETLLRDKLRETSPACCPSLNGGKSLPGQQNKEAASRADRQTVRQTEKDNGKENGVVEQQQQHEEEA